MNAIEQIKEVFPSCYDCGVDFTVDSEQEAMEYLSYNQAYRESLSVKSEDKDRIRVRMGWVWLCPTCLFARNRNNDAAEHERRKTLLLERTFHTNKLPRAAIVENFVQSQRDIENINAESWALARSWNVDFSMWIQGTKGTGKTYMAHCVLNKALNDVHSVYEVNSIDFCEWVYRQGEKERKDASHVDVLMLDDIDKAEWRVDSIIALWRLMDIRHRDKLTTIITANVSPEVMRSRWRNIEGHDRNVVDPMIDRMQGFKRITLEGKSLR